MLTALLYDLYWGYIMKIIRTDQNGWGRVRKGIKFSISINAFVFHHSEPATLYKYKYNNVENGHKKYLIQ